MLSHPSALPRNPCHANSPPPTPIHSHACHATHIHSPQMIPPRPCCTLTIPPTTASGAVRSVHSYLFAPTVRPRCPRPRRVLPLRLTQQPIPLSRLPRQPLHIPLRILPTYAHHRIPLPLGESRSPPRTRIVQLPFPFRVVPNPATTPHIVTRLPHEHPKLPTRYLVLTYPNPLPYSYLMPGTFIITSICFVNRRPHHETTRRQHHHLRTLGTVPEFLPRTHLLTRATRRLRSRLGLPPASHVPPPLPVPAASSRGPLALASPPHPPIALNASACSPVKYPVTLNPFPSCHSLIAPRVFSPNNPSAYPTPNPIDPNPR